MVHAGIEPWQSIMRQNLSGWFFFMCVKYIYFLFLLAELTDMCTHEDECPHAFSPDILLSIKDGEGTKISDETHETEIKSILHLAMFLFLVFSV